MKGLIFIRKEKSYAKVAEIHGKTNLLSLKLWIGKKKYVLVLLLHLILKNLCPGGMAFRLSPGWYLVVYIFLVICMPYDFFFL